MAPVGRFLQLFLTTGEGVGFGEWTVPGEGLLQ